MIAALRQHRLPYGLVLPAMLVILLVVGYPFLYNLYLSLTDMRLTNVRNPSLIGFDNYVRLFAEPDLWTTLGKTVVWTVTNVTFHVGIGVALALMLNGRFPGQPVFRALLILPWAMPQYIAALTWRGLFNYEYGAFNLILAGWFGLEKVPWLSNEVWAFVAPILTNIWLGFPFMMVIALGGLQSIPHELYEAASIDGASPWQRFRHVTVPMLRPVMVPAISLGTIWTFNNLNVLWLVTDGGEPADSTHILVTYVYKAAFEYYRYGYAAAFSVMIFLVLLGFVVWFMRANRATGGATT